jgi:F-type H+-transporting ATPase subunit a
MPEHTTFLHYVLHLLFAHTPMGDGVDNVGHSLMGQHLGYRDFEPLFMALIVMLLVIYLATEVRGTYRDLKTATVPETTLSLRTFFEVFFSYFYELAKSVMGPENAKRYFPLIGASGIFIFFSNCLTLVPGFSPPTSNWNVTAGCALLVFLSFNYYGLKVNGIGYLKHMAGWGVFKSVWANAMLALLMFPIELISMCVRPVTLSVRLMLNMAVDHLLASILLGMFALLVPLPVMMLGVIVICVQTLVFCLLTSIYIGLATAHEEHH